MSVLDATLGALFIAMVIGAFLHGITLSQAWYFFVAQGQQFQDTLQLKILVGVVVTLDFIHQVCTTHWIYTFCVTSFGDAAALAILPPSYLGMAYPTGFVTLLVQGFYTWRIWKLAEKQWYIPLFILACAMVQEGIQLYSMHIIGQNRDSTQFTSTLGNIVIIVNSIAAAIDFLIAGAMIYLLIGRHKSKIARTNHILRSIAIYTVTTGTMTSVCALLVLVMAVAMPQTQYVLLFYVLLSRMYSNSLLATLNVRTTIRQAGSNGVVIHSSQMQSHHPADAEPNSDSSYHLEDLKRGASGSATHQSIAIKVDTNRQTDVDF